MSNVDKAFTTQRTTPSSIHFPFMQHRPAIFVRTGSCTFARLRNIQNWNRNNCRNNSNRRSRYWKASTWGLLCAATTSRYFRSSQAMSTVSMTMSTSESQKIAIGQVCTTSSKWNNLLNVAMCAGWATSSSSSSLPDGNRCSMLFLPECFGFLGSNAEETLRAAEPSTTITTSNPDIVRSTLIDVVQECSSLPMNQVPNHLPAFDALNIEDEWKLSLIDGLRIISQTSKLWISAGSIHVLCPEEESGINHTNEVNVSESAIHRRVFNTHIIMDHTGTIRSEYRKIHLFDVCIPEKNVDLRESKTTRPGTELIVCPNTPIGCLGVTVCYDLRFPEIYTQLVQNMGAQVLLVPSAFTIPTGHAHWHTLLRARAIENQCYVIAAAQYGQHNEKRASYGHSLVVDGWGTVIADAGGMDSTIQPSSTQPTITTCEIDLTTIDSIRERMPIQQHRVDAQFTGKTVLYPR